MRSSLALLAIPLVTITSVAHAKPIGEMPPGARELADMPAYVTGLAANDASVFWGTQSFADASAGGIYRVDVVTGAETELWTGRAVGQVRVGAADVFFTYEMDGKLAALDRGAAAGAAARDLVDAKALAEAAGMTDPANVRIADFAVAGDRLVVAVSPFGPCRDAAGAIVTTALDGTGPRLVAKTCPSPLSVDATHVYWREWGKKKEDGTRDLDRVVRAPLAPSGAPAAPQVLVSAKLYLDPVVVGDDVFYCDETERKEGLGGLVKVPKAGGKPKLVVPNVSWRLARHPTGPALLAIDPIKNTLAVLDPKSGSSTSVPEAQGIQRITTHGFDLYFSVCDAPTRCVLRTTAFLDANAIQIP